MEERKDRVVLIGASLGDKSLNDTDEASMKELKELVKTANGEVVGEVIQNIKTIDPSTLVQVGYVDTEDINYIPREWIKGDLK